MTHIIQGNSLNELFLEAASRLTEKGKRSSSRNGEVTFLNNVVFELSDPTKRHLYLDGRKNNIFAVIAELFWIMSGSDEISPFLEFYLPRAKDFSDDGVTWRGGYGPRLYAHDQLEQAIEVFHREGLDTRRSVIDIYQSELDSPLYFESTKDVPCNNMMHFYVDDGKMCMNVFSRSADLVWGVTNVNIPEWTFLQEYVAQAVGVPVGSYTHWCSNLHVYDFTSSQVEEALQTDSKGLASTAGRTCIFPDQPRWFFEDLLTYYTDIIEDRDHGGALEDIFKDYNVPTENNQLWDYAIALSAHTAAKVSGNPHQVGCTMSDDFVSALEHSAFRKFDLT